MNPIRKKILKIISFFSYKWQKSWLHNHIKGNCDFIANEILCHKLKAKDIYIKLPTRIIGEQYITIGKYTR